MLEVFLLVTWIGDIFSNRSLVRNMVQPPVSLHKRGLKCGRVQQFNAKGHPGCSSALWTYQRHVLTLPANLQCKVLVRALQNELGEQVTQLYQHAKKRLYTWLNWASDWLSPSVEHCCWKRDVNSFVSGLQRPPPFPSLSGGPCRVLNDQTGWVAVRTHPTVRGKARMWGRVHLLQSPRASCLLKKGWRPM